MPTATPMMTITIAPPPQGWSGNVAQLFQLLENNIEITVPDGFLVGTIGSVTPPDNSGPWLKNGTTWYIWDTVSQTYIPQASINEIGQVHWFAQTATYLDTSSIRSQYLRCNGGAFPRSAPYNLLYAQIGTSFGAGDGSTTFNVPNIDPIMSGTVPIIAAIRYA